MVESTHASRECDEVRELLWPMDRPRECVGGEEVARAHLEACPSCRAFFRRDAAITDALRRHGLHVHAPRELRERVFDALARERAPGAVGPAGGSTPVWPSRLVPVGAVAAVALMIGLGISGAPGNDVLTSRGTAGGPYVRDFLSRAVEAGVVAPPDPEAVTAFFTRELGVLVEPVVFETGRVARAMICLIEGERAAMVEYEIDGRTVAHYLVPTAGQIVSPSGVRSGSQAGVQFVSWSDDRFEHALVSNLPEAALTDLARRRFAMR